jgi:ribosomal protein S27E
MNTSDPTAHPGQRLNTSDDAAHGFTPDMFEERTPKQPAPVFMDCHGCGERKTLDQFPVDPSVGGLCNSCNDIITKQPAPICAGCTTPAIMCPSANDDKSRVIDCASKNITTPEPAPVKCPVCKDTKQVWDMQNEQYVTCLVCSPKQPAPGDGRDAVQVSKLLSTSIELQNYLIDNSESIVDVPDTIWIPFSKAITDEMSSQQQPTAQDVKGALDIPACLSQMIATLDKAVDQTPYEDEKDALINAMEQLQVAAKVSDKIVQFEFQEDKPLAKGVPMNHNG